MCKPGMTDTITIGPLSEFYSDIGSKNKVNPIILSLEDGNNASENLIFVNGKTLYEKENNYQICPSS